MCGFRRDFVWIFTGKRVHGFWWNIFTIVQYMIETVKLHLELSYVFLKENSSRSKTCFRAVLEVVLFPWDGISVLENFLFSKQREKTANFDNRKTFGKKMAATKTCCSVISDLILFTFLRRVGEQVHCSNSRKTPPREDQRVHKHFFKPLSPSANDRELM